MKGPSSGEPGRHASAGPIPPAMWALALLFFLKAAALALFVTPLWDVPDELAHFATVSDLASGRGIPRPGASVVPPAAVALWNRSFVGQPVYNWTAIHPPGYHALAVPFLWAARAASNDLEWQVRGTRLFSALCGAAGLLVFFLVIFEVSADRTVSLAAAAAVGFIPMYSHMSSGVSHDILCAALGGLAALFWLRWLRTQSPRDALALALALAAAGAVKATAVPLAVALLLLFVAHLPGRFPGRLARASAFAVVAFSTTAAWTLWRGELPGADARPAAGPPRPLTPGGLLDVLRDAPVLDHTFKNFLGLIGWTGTGKGTLAWFQISGAFLAIYLLLATLILVLAVSWAWRRDFTPPATRADTATAASWVCGGVVLIAAFSWLASRPATAWPKLLLDAFFLAVLSVSLFRVSRPRRAPESAVFSSQFAVLVFTAAYLFHIARNALSTGIVHGTHGRYYFVVIGFLLAGLVFPACDRLAGWPGRNRVLLLIAVLLFVNEAAFFLIRVVPFYRGGGPTASLP